VRSGLLAVVIAGLTACSSATGLQFEIDASGDPTASQLVVYIGKGDGQPASIAAELRSPSDAHQGRFWPFGLEPQIFDLTASDRTVTLSFAPGDESPKVTVVVVGLTGDVATSVATQTVAHVRTDVVEVWTLKLEPTEVDVEITSGRAVQRWGEEPEQHTCVQAVDRAARAPEPQNIFIGTAGDRDCDGRLEVLKDGARNPDECDDDWHDAVFKPSIDTLSCMEEHTDPALMAEGCMFGARECADGNGGTNTDCGHSLPFCAHAALCRVCSGTKPEDRFKCALELDPREHAQEVQFIRCPIQVDIAQTPPRACEQTLKAGPETVWGGYGSVCQGVPLYHSPDPATAWSSMVQIGGLSLGMSLVSTTGCAIQIVPTQIPGQAIDPSAFPEHGLVAVELRSGRGAVVPILFAYEPVMGCTIVDRACTTSLTVPPAGETIQKCLGFTPLNP